MTSTARPMSPRLLGADINLGYVCVVLAPAGFWSALACWIGQTVHGGVLFVAVFAFVGAFLHFISVSLKRQHLNTSQAPQPVGVLAAPLAADAQDVAWPVIA